MNGLHEPCLRIAHGLAVAAALCGLYLMIVESIDLGLYGMMLFGLALGVEVTRARLSIVTIEMTSRHIGWI
jgi:hypothetical protein